MFSRNYQKLRAYLTLAEAAALILVFAAAYFTRAMMEVEQRTFALAPSTVILLLSICLLAWPLCGQWLHTYQRLESAKLSRIVIDTFQQCLFGTACIVIAQYVLRLDISRMFVALFGAYSFVFLGLIRANRDWFARTVSGEFGSKHYCLIVGTGASAARMAQAIRESERYGMHLLGMLSIEGRIDPSIAHETVYPYSFLPKLLEHQVIDEVIFAPDGDQMSRMTEAMSLCDDIGVRTRLTIDSLPRQNPDVYLDRLQGIPLLSFSASPQDEMMLLLKRLLDVAGALAALVLVAPAMALVAILIKLTSPGPVIFRQERCGVNGRKFTFYKFRSMVDNAEELKASLIHRNEKQIAFKIAADPRVTPLGRWLRKFSIDEWPQLFNVLKGDMSLVGPRPAVPGEVFQYESWYRRRLRMRPGLTCLWALEGRDALNFNQWMQKDIEYIENWSIALDLRIMALTVPVVLSGKGAH